MVLAEGSQSHQPTLTTRDSTPSEHCFQALWHGLHFHWPMRNKQKVVILVGGGNTSYSQIKKLLFGD